jgi:hypothetical protein
MRSGSPHSQIRADRKGAIAFAASGTVGWLYIILALGSPDAALILAFAHAVLRTLQILRSHNALYEVSRRGWCAIDWDAYSCTCALRVSWAAGGYRYDFDVI